VASQQAIVSGIAGRYAVALFDLAADGKVLDSVESDLIRLVALSTESEEFSTLVESPIIARSEQVKAVAAVTKAAELNALTGKFLGVLAVNGRLNALVSIAGAFATLLSDHRGEVTADVVSSTELSDNQLGDLKSQLKKAVGRDVAIEASVDATLIGGLVVKVGSRMVDTSIKTKLDNLAIAMKGVQ